MDPLDLVGSWASVMMDRASQCRTRWLQARNIQDDSVRTANLLVGTDCSGADAPMFALEGLNIRVKQMFACDVALHCLRFLDFRSVSRGQDPDLYSNMLKRDHESLKDINAYYCGFPCKPWSTLNNFSKYFESPDFLPFKASADKFRVKNIKCNSNTVYYSSNTENLRSHLPCIRK